ncbi:MAG: UDP-N-acetylmuramoyl-tripeptide--D-alanyl-D-alanine ligase [Treponema sp.]|nr:UDP-N-acetylmuramoyl-tripeptide--D-alanyl-D-alanine ligase [Treponema sp.]
MESLLTLNELVCGVKGTCIGSANTCFFSSVTTDSRNVVKDSLFVPLVGENQDGHIYITQALEKAASVIFLNNSEYEKKSAYYDELACKNSSVAFIKVENTLHALQDAAKTYVEKFPNLIKVSITGSCGKTTTKELMAAVCLRHFGEEHTVFTKGNFNSETGLPLSVFNIRKEDQIGVFEMGMNRVNEIGEISAVLKSKYGIITNIGTAHIGILGSRENIACEKRKSFAYIPEDGAAFVPAADDFADYCTENVKGKVVKFGLEKENLEKLGISDIQDCGILGSKFKLDGIEVSLHLGGDYNLINALGVISCAKELGIPSEEIKDGLEDVNGLAGRLEIKDLELSTKVKILLVQDCYNANLDSMSASIDFCAKIKSAGKKIFVLGDMKELGDSSESAHREIGRKVNAVADSFVFFVGPEMKAAYQECEDKNRVLYYKENDNEAFEAIVNKIQTLACENDLLLLKGSHSMSLEKISDLILKNGGCLKNASL